MILSKWFHSSQIFLCFIVLIPKNVDFISFSGFMASGNANKRSGDHQGPAGGAKKLKKTQVDFSVGDSNLTDVVLVVEGQRFHVLKGVS